MLFTLFGFIITHLSIHLISTCLTRQSLARDFAYATGVGQKSAPGGGADARKGSLEKKSGPGPADVQTGIRVVERRTAYNALFGAGCSSSR